MQKTAHDLAQSAIADPVHALAILAFVFVLVWAAMKANRRESLGSFLFAVLIMTPFAVGFVGAIH